MIEVSRSRKAVEWVLGVAVVATMLSLSIIPNIPPAQIKGKIPSEGDYWADRMSYPTGNYDARWQIAALEDDQRMERGVPSGLRRNLRGGSSPLTLDANAFSFLGPQPLINGGYGEVAGRINWLVVDPVDTTIAYAGSDGGGVWKSTNCCDANMTWTPKTDSPLLNSIAIGHIVIDPNDHNVVYAGTGDLRYGSFSFGSAGLLRSQDQGESWEILGEDVFNAIYDQPAGGFPQYQAIGKVQVDPRDSNNIVVGTKQGIYFSYDFGSNWSGPCFTNGHSTQRQDTTGLELIDLGSSTKIVAAIGTRGFNTTVQPDLDQNGANGLYDATLPASGCPVDWNLITRGDNGWPAGTGAGTPYPSNTMGRIDIAVAPSNPNVMYAQVASIPSRNLLGVWRTGDAGATWQQTNSGGTSGCDDEGGQSWYDAGIIVDPNDPDTTFISEVDVFRSTNGGVTYTNFTCGYVGGSTHVDHHARAFVGNDSSQMLIGSDGGVYYVPNADTATASNIDLFPVNDTLGTIEFYSGDITANFATAANPGINAGAQDNGSSVKIWSDGDPTIATWTRRNGGDGMYARIEPIQEQRWYQESQNGNIRVYPNGPFGSSQSAENNFGGDTLSFVMPYELNKFDCGPTICEQMIAGTTRVWETVVGAIPATSWYPNSPDLTKGTLGNRSFVNQLSFAVDDGNTDGHIDVAVAGTNDGNFWMGFGMGQGSADTATWVNLTDGNAVLPNRPILDVATDPATATIGYASIGGFDENTPLTPGRVFQVTCNADCSAFTWANKTGNLPNVPANSIIANPNFPQQVFVGTDWGLYYTNNINITDPVWFKFTAGLPSVMIWDMSIDRGFTTLVLWTRSRGAYAWPLPFNSFGDFIFWDSLEDLP